MISLDTHSGLDDDWKESCDLPSGWIKQEKQQQDFKNEMVISLDENSIREDGWKESWDLPRGWINKDNQHDFKKGKVTSLDEDISCSEGEKRNSQHDPNLTNEGWKGTKILPDELKHEVERRNTQHDPGPVDVGWEMKQLLHNELKSEGIESSSKSQVTALEKVEDWLEQVAISCKPYQLICAVDDTASCITDLQEEETWLNEFVKNLGLDGMEDNRSSMREVVWPQHDQGTADDALEKNYSVPHEVKREDATKNWELEPGPAEYGWEGKQILPDEWKREGEKKISQYNQGSANDGLETKPILPDEWKSEGDRIKSQYVPGSAHDCCGGKHILTEDGKK